MNILITSAGRRVELVQEFQAKLDKILPGFKVFTMDLNPSLSAACQVSDKSFKAPRVTDSTYPELLLDLCLSNNIGMVVPTIDTELLVLSIIEKDFQQHKINVITCSSELVGLCRDKRETIQLYEKLAIGYPELYSLDNMTYPAFCKPYDGSCSNGAFKLSGPDDLSEEIVSNSKNIYTEFIDSNFKEYTCDAYFDSSSQLKCLVPRERLEIRSGEVSKGVTRKNFVYDFLIDKISYIKGARGCVTFQVFGNPSTSEVKALEINPRFGGGYPLTSSAGVSYVEWLIREYFFEESIPFRSDWKDGLVMLRYDAKVITNA